MDTLLIPGKDNAQLIQWFNLGYEAEKYIGRKERFSDGDKKVHCYCPKVFDGLTEAQIPRATLSRILVVIMHPKPMWEHLERERFSDYDALDRLKTEIDEWYPTIIEELKQIDLNARVPLPETEFLYNRNAQIWLPLLAIASLAGEEWYQRALKAARFFTELRREKNTSHYIIRAMCRLYMTGQYKRGIHTTDMLLPALHDLGIPKFIDAEKVANILRGYYTDNYPKGIRLNTPTEKMKNRRNIFERECIKLRGQIERDRRPKMRHSSPPSGAYRVKRVKAARNVVLAG